ncbi:PnuC-like nicotinamide mononucleotide transport [Vibrio phage D480]
MYDLLFNIQHTLFTIADYPVSGLELWATLTGLICVVMARMNLRHNFTVGIVNCIGFAILLFQVQLYSDVLLQGFFILASIYGFVQWSKKDANEVPITYLKMNEWRVSIIATLVGTLTLAHFIDPIMNASGSLLVSDYTHIPAELAMRDAFTTCASIMAFALMCQRKVEAWFYWCAVNVVCIFNYATQGVIVLAAEYAVFLINAIWALWAWHTTAHDNAIAQGKELEFMKEQI